MRCCRFGAGASLVCSFVSLLGFSGCEWGNDSRPDVTETRHAKIIGGDSHDTTASQALPERAVGWITNTQAGTVLFGRGCTATPIKRDVVLTAGHCVCLDDRAGVPDNTVIFHLNHIDPATGLLVDVGTNKNGIPASRVETDTLFCDPFQTVIEPSNYVPKDLAILILSEPLSVADVPELPDIYTLSDFMDRAFNRPEDANFYERPIEIVGWDGSVPFTPPAVPIKKLANAGDPLFDAYKVFRGGIFCAGDVLCTNKAPGIWIHDLIDVVIPANRLLIQAGDSGGPLTFRQNLGKPTVIGVASIGQSGLAGGVFGPFNSWSPTFDNGGLKGGEFIRQFLDDADVDGVSDTNDNCSPPRCSSKEKCFNPNQDDSDGDGIGDTCDNCAPSICTTIGVPSSFCANAAQEDRGDHDGVGDVCDLCSEKTTSTFESDKNDDGVGDSCDNCASTPGGGRLACRSSSDCVSGGFCITTDVRAGRCADGTNRACNTPTGISCFSCQDIGTWGVCSRSLEVDTDNDGMGNRCDSCSNLSDANLQQNSNLVAEQREFATPRNDACDTAPVFSSRPVLEPFNPNTSGPSRTLFTSFAGVGSETSSPHGPYPPIGQPGAPVGFRHCDCPPDLSTNDCLLIRCGSSREAFDLPDPGTTWKRISIGASPQGSYSEAAVTPAILDRRLDVIYTGGIDCSDPHPHQTYVTFPMVVGGDKNLCRLGTGTGQLVSWATNVDIDAGRVASFTASPTPVSGEPPLNLPVRQTVGMFWSHGASSPFNSAGSRDAAFNGRLRDNYVYLKTPSLSYDMRIIPRLFPATPANCAINPQCRFVFTTDWLKPLINPGSGLNVLRLLSRPFIVFPDCIGSGTLCGIRRSTEPHIDLSLLLTDAARFALLDSTRFLVTSAEPFPTDVSLVGGVVAVSVPRSWSQLDSDVEGLGANFSGQLDTIAVYQTDSENRPENVIPFGGDGFVPSDREGARWLFSKTEQMLYMIGGVRGGQPTGEIWRLDLRTGAWTHLFTQGPTSQVGVRNVAAAAYDSVSGKLTVIDDSPGSSPQSARVVVFDTRADTAKVAALADLRAFTKVSLTATGGGAHVLVGAKASSWNAYRFQLTSSNKVTWTAKTSGQGLVLADPVSWQEGPGVFVQNGQDIDTKDLPQGAFTPSGTPPELGVCEQPLIVPPPAPVVISTCHLPAIQPPTVTSGCGPISAVATVPTDFKLGSTTISWAVSDGLGNTVTVSQTVTAVLGDDASCCPAGTNVIVGTPNNDNITGTSGADCIIALGAQDTINGGGGNDFISAGEGDDIVRGGLGDDQISGGGGQDQLFGDDGNDRLSGGTGDDQCFGGNGNDVLSGGTGQDKLFGDAGADQLLGEDGDDRLSGGAGNDALDGGLGHNACSGGTGTNQFLRCESFF